MNNIKEQDLLICPSCGALVYAETADTHKNWHETFLMLGNPITETTE
jgi:hypothetical protein